MTYASVCSGVDAASLAWLPLGWRCAFFSEIEPYPCAVLRERWPDVPNLGDISKIKVERNEDGTLTCAGADGSVRIAGIDVLVGGTPCQDVSVAGKRVGLVEGTRSRLAFDYARLAYELRVGFTVWENVPGVLSANAGKDFAAFLSSLAGWEVEVPGGGWQNSGFVSPASDGNFGLAYRVLDAQFCRVDGFPFAVPQRRRRVFVIGCLGDAPRAGEILFEREGVSGHPPPRFKTRQAAASGTGVRTGSAEPVAAPPVSPCIDRCMARNMNNQNAEFGKVVIVPPRPVPSHPCNGPKCYEADHCIESDANRTLVGGHDSHVSDATTLVCEETERNEDNGNQQTDGWRAARVLAEPAR